MAGPYAALTARAGSVAALLLSLSGCGLLLPSRPGTAPTVTVPPSRESALIVVTDQDSAAAMKNTAALIAATARTGERVLVLSNRSGAVLATSLAPPPPAVQVATAPPSPLPSHPTTFQEADHKRAAEQYQAAVRQARALLMKRQQAGLAAWATSVIAAAEKTGATGGREHSGEDPRASTGLDAAATALASLRQAGTSADMPVVVAVAGVSEEAARSIPILGADLQACTVAVDDFAGDSSEEAAWQEALLQAGAARVALLVPATDSQFASVVRQGLDGSVTDTLTSVLFGPGQYRLSRAALPQLRQLLRLVTVRYPHAAATIDGYTDDLPVPGGNLKLSQLRAEAVLSWLVAHGVARGRLQAFGYGATDPLAPNTISGQPLNRRVVAVIDPAVD